MNRAPGRVAATAASWLAQASVTNALPGPWDAKWGPMETWKSGLYDRTFFGLALPLEPMGALYKKAWDRILAGDLPRFEEAVREKKKR